jgi:inner membrane protein
MFLAHLPAGYLLTKILQKKFRTEKFMSAGLLGSIFPDFDIFWFYFIDQKRHLHHSYLTHIPSFWLLLYSITFFAISITSRQKYKPLVMIFFAAIFSHLVLDTVVGKIQWLSPFNNTSYYLFEVPVQYNFWVWNFIFHWSFRLEIIIIVITIYVWFKSYKSKII